MEVVLLELSAARWIEQIRKSERESQKAIENAPMAVSPRSVKVGNLAARRGGYGGSTLLHPSPGTCSRRVIREDPMSLRSRPERAHHRASAEVWSGSLTSAQAQACAGAAAIEDAIDLNSAPPGNGRGKADPLKWRNRNARKSAPIKCETVKTIPN
jgi:hypothetical protein